MRSSRRLPLLIILPLLLGIPSIASVALAEEDPTVGVVSISSYEQFMQHANVLGEIMGFPNLQQMVELQIAQLTGGQVIQSLDKTKPIVVDVRLGKKEPYALVCLPVTSLKELLQSLPAPLGETEDVGNDVLRLKNTPDPMYIKAGDGWSYWTQKKDHLVAVPKNPEQLVADLPKKYLVGFRALMQKIPPEKRAEAIGFLELMAQMSLAGGGGDANNAVQLESIQQQIAMLRQWIDDTNEVTLGVGLDKEDKSVHFDVIMTAKSGSDIEKSYARFKKGKSDHAGFLHEDAAIGMSVNLHGKPAKEELDLLNVQQKMLHAQMIANLDSAPELSEEEKGQLKEASGKLMDIFYDTARSDNIQAGMAAFVNERSTIVFGGKVTDGNALEGAIKQLVEIAGKKLSIPLANWEAENHGFYRIHTWKTSVPDEDTKQLLGEELEIAIGVNASSIYLAIGGNSIADLKKTIDAAAEASKTPSDPFEAFVKLGPLVDLAASQEDGKQFVPLTGMLREKDQIIYAVQPVAGGIHLRIVFQQNLLRAIPMMGMVMGGPRGQVTPKGPGADSN